MILCFNRCRVILSLSSPRHSILSQGRINSICRALCVDGGVSNICLAGTCCTEGIRSNTACPQVCTHHSFQTHHCHLQFTVQSAHTHTLNSPLPLVSSHTHTHTHTQLTVATCKFNCIVHPGGSCTCCMHVLVLRVRSLIFALILEQIYVGIGETHVGVMAPSSPLLLLHAFVVLLFKHKGRRKAQSVCINQ